MGMLMLSFCPHWPVLSDFEESCGQQHGFLAACFWSLPEALPLSARYLWKRSSSHPWPLRNHNLLGWAVRACAVQAETTRVTVPDSDSTVEAPPTPDASAMRGVWIWETAVLTITPTVRVRSSPPRPRQRLVWSNSFNAWTQSEIMNGMWSPSWHHICFYLLAFWIVEPMVLTCVL